MIADQIKQINEMIKEQSDKLLKQDALEKQLNEIRMKNSQYAI